MGTCEGSASPTPITRSGSFVACPARSEPASAAHGCLLRMTLASDRAWNLRNPVLRLDAMAAPNAYELDDSVARVDMEVVWGYLSTEAYWSRWRTREIVEQQIKTAWRVIGVY